jgi:RNA polymerase sigma factor (sigma-70 family)
MLKSRETRARREAEATRQMEELVAAHESALLRYALGILHDSHAAQDAVQNAFIKLFRQWQPGLRPSASVRNWLYAVTHNEAVDYLRRETRLHLLHQRQAAEPTLAPAPAPAHPGNPGNPGAERVEWVLRHLRRLSLGEQQVVLLRLQEGLAYEDIGRVTGRTVGNVGCLLHNAVKKLSEMARRQQQVQP